MKTKYSVFQLGNYTDNDSEVKETESAEIPYASLSGRSWQSVIYHFLTQLVTNLWCFEDLACIFLLETYRHNTILLKVQKHASIGLKLRQNKWLVASFRVKPDAVQQVWGFPKGDCQYDSRRIHYRDEHEACSFRKKITRISRQNSWYMENCANIVELADCLGHLMSQPALGKYIAWDVDMLEPIFISRPLVWKMSYLRTGDNDHACLHWCGSRCAEPL